MKTVMKEVSPLSLAFSLVLASFSFFFRADNLFIGLFEAHETTVFFLVFLLIGGLCSSGLLVFETTRKKLAQTGDIQTDKTQASTTQISITKTIRTRNRSFLIKALAGGLSLALGEIIATPLLGSPSLAALFSCLIGFLSGFGFVLLVYTWGLIFRTYSAWGVVLNTGVALLGGILISFALGHLGNVLLLCLCLGVLSLLSMTCLVVFSLKARNGFLPDESLPPSQNDNRLKPHTELATLHTTRELVSYLWAGYFGTTFNFFTMGLTFWPMMAGLGSGGPSTTKLVSYCVIVVFFFLLCFILGAQSQRKLEFSYRIALPIAAAIVLATPFLDNLIPIRSIAIISWVPYSGIALLYLLGFVTMLWTSRRTEKPFSWFIALSTVSCCIGFAAGLVVFKLLGQQAQIVSLCILSVYLLMMVLMATLDGYREKSTRSDEAPELDQNIFQALSTEYSLSPREQEILVYLAKGRGAKHIGDKLYISAETVRTHTKRIYEKMDVHNREELLDILESHS